MEQRVIPFEPARPYSGLLDREPPEPSRVELFVKDWVQRHRPAGKNEGRSWFVILAAVCIGIALLVEPVYFVALAVVFIGLAWWRRESARSGVRDVVIGAFVLGAIASVAAVAYYFMLPLVAS